MKPKSPRQIQVQRRVVLPILVALLVIGAIKPPIRADDFILQVSFDTAQTSAVALNLLVGQSRMIRFDQSIGRLSVSNPEIAEAVVVTGDQVLVNGKTFGHVNFVAWDKSGERPVVFDVSVRVNLTLMESLLRELFPTDSIQLSQANGSVVLSGKVSDAKKVTLAEAAVQAAGFKTVNLLRGPFKDAAQVQLQVQVAEVNRSRARELGLAYLYQASPGKGGYINSGSGPASIDSVLDGVITGTLGSTLNVLFLGGNLNAFVQALHTNGALRTLAEPNLIAMDGAEASFLAGGEFPVPIVQGSGNASQVTIVYKEFGVRLSFKPTIIDEDHIRLELQPEVSTLDFANGVMSGGFNLPALKTRRAKTSVELKNTQSFALAGLLDNSDSKNLSKVPLLGDIPILGALFRSTSFQKQETELMFIITVNLVKPVEKQSLPAMPGLKGLKSTSSPLTETPAPKTEGEGTNEAASGENATKPEQKPSESPSQPPAAALDQSIAYRSSRLPGNTFNRRSALMERVATERLICGPNGTLNISGISLPH